MSTDAVGKSRNTKPNAHIIAALVFVAGLSASVCLWSLIGQREARIHDAEFGWLARERCGAIERELHEDVELLFAIAGLFSSSDFVDQDEFQTFCEPLLDRHRSVLAFEWAPRVAVEDRAEFEADLSESAGRQMTISEIGKNRCLQTAGPREVYYPVRYVVQRDDEKSEVLGFDHSSDAPRWEAMKKSLDYNDAVMSERLILYRVHENEKDRSGVLVALPIYGKRSTTEVMTNRDVLGFAIGVFRVHDVVVRALADFGPGGVNMLILDHDAEVGNRLIYSRASRTQSDDESVSRTKLVSRNHRHYHEVPLEIANRNWVIACTPSDYFFLTRHSSVPAVMFLALTLATCAFSLCTYLVIGRAERVERLVDHRTDELRAANKQLFNNESQTRAILETATDAIITTDANGTILAVNSATESMFGYEAYEVVGEDVSLLVPNSFFHHRTAEDRGFTEPGAIHLTGGSRETMGTRRDGVEFPIQLSVTQIDADPESEPMFTGIVRDITCQRRMAATLASHSEDLTLARNELEQSNQELDEFTLAISRDLQDPLRKLGSFSDLLQHDLGDDVPSQVKKDVNGVVQAVRHARRIVQDLLSLSRINRAVLNEELVDLNDCVDRAIESVQTRIDETNATIHRDELPTLPCDAAMLTQVYEKLLQNALTFVSHSAPQIHITAERVGAMWLLGVKDNGIGIDSSNHDRVFKPFQQLSNREDQHGTGIGLATCRKLIQRQRGTLFVESKLGEGAHFKFTLPANQDDSGAVSTSQFMASAGYATSESSPLSGYRL